MRAWQVERRKRTRHLIELGGLVVKAGVVELTGDDRAILYGALLWMADKLRSDEHDKALALWAAKGKQGFERESPLLRGERKDANEKGDLLPICVEEGHEIHEPPRSGGTVML